MSSDFLAGWVGGISVLAVCHPFDTVKVRLQMMSHTQQSHHQQQLQRPSVASVTSRTTPHSASVEPSLSSMTSQSSSSSMMQRQYPSSSTSHPSKRWRFSARVPGGGGGLQTAIDMFQYEGIKSFYRGVWAPIAGVGVANAMLFGVYGRLTSWMTKRRDQRRRDRSDLSGHLQNTTELSVYENCLCATAGGIAHATFMTPFEVVKLRLQTLHMFDHRNYYGSLDCGRKLYAEGGLRKLYLGYWATLVRDIPGSIVYFGSYGILRQLLPQKEGDLNVMSVLFAGGCAGVAQWIVIIPLDTIKTRVQLSKKGLYLDWIHAGRTILRKEGLASFYRGVGPAVLRAFFANAACFVGVEAAMMVMRR